MTDSGRRRVLFVAEAVTLAHVTRPLLLAEALDPVHYEVHFACADRFGFVFDGASFSLRRIRSITPERFLRALASGARLYDDTTLAAYVEEDMRLIDEVRPDLVVGDFRLSLAVSAQLCHVPYAAVTNAYWSPYAERRFPLPEHPLARFLGITAADFLFQCVRPAIFAYHARPMNKLRRRYGLAPLGGLCEVYTYGDYTLYADVPALIPTRAAPGSHHYIGPLLWSPKTALPPWWDALPQDRPCVYVTLGSSGRAVLLPRLVAALSALPISVMVATAGRIALSSLPGNVWAAEFLPGDQAARRSALVVSNGGSPTTYQALAAGVPVLGIASNMDQHLNMGYVARAGAGLLMRAGRVTDSAVRGAVGSLIEDEAYKAAAGRFASEGACFSAPDRFASLVEKWLA